jgi:hypothetical protein
MEGIAAPVQLPGGQRRARLLDGRSMARKKDLQQISASHAALESTPNAKVGTRYIDWCGAHVPNNPTVTAGDRFQMRNAVLHEGTPPAQAVPAPRQPVPVLIGQPQASSAQLRSEDPVSLDQIR